jgi:hypothetical protein
LCHLWLQHIEQRVFTGAYFLCAEHVR